MVQPFTKVVVFAALALVSYLYAPRLAFAQNTQEASAASSFPALLKTTGLELADFGTPVMKIYTQNEGLPISTVTSITFDQKGYLWVGSVDGIARYNRRRWLKVNPPNKSLKYINRLFSAKDGSIWVGTSEDGLLQFINGKWRSFTTDSGLPGNFITSITEITLENNEHTIMVGTTKGLARLNGDRWTIIDTNSGLPDNSVLSILETKSPANNTQLWIGTKKGLARLENGKWTVFDTSSGLPNNEVISLLEKRSADGRTIIWAGTRSGVAKLEDGVWSRLENSLGFQYNIVHNLFLTKSRDGNDILWIGTANGLLRVENNKSTIYDINSGLPDNLILSIADNKYQDMNQTLWLGTRKGLVRFTEGKGYTFKSDTKLLDDAVNTILVSRATATPKTLWIGTLNSGLLKFENGLWTVYDTKSGLPHNTIITLYETIDQSGSSTIWACTNNGLAAINGDKLMVYDTTSGLPHNIVYTFTEAVYADGTSKCYAGTNNGLAYFDKGRWVSLNLPPNQPTPVRGLLFTSSPDGQGILWVATNKGLGFLKNDRWHDFHEITGIPRTTVFKISETTSADGSKRYLWFGTNNSGVYRVDLSSDKFDTANFSETSNPAIPSNIVTKVVQDFQKRIYIFTVRGAVRLTPNPSSHSPGSAEYTAQTLSIEEGFANLEILNAYIDQSKKYMWVGTTKGFVMVDLENVLNDAAPKPIYIENLLLNGEQQELVNNLSLGYNDNNLTFSYSLLSYFRESECLFKSQLLGFDREPSEWNTKTESVYTNLPKGSYIFRVWAKDYAGNLSGPVDYAFEINPAPWNTWWAYTFYALGFAGIFYGGLQYRLKAQQKQIALLDSMVQERTKELASKNGELAVMNDELAKEKRALASMNDELAKEKKALEISQQQANRIFSALADALPGTILDEKYRLEEKLGSGGFGVVFKAMHLGLNRTVAVKVFKPTSGNDSALALERFRLEGVSACRINHPNAISILDSGISTQGIAYIVMELLDGRSLADELSDNEKISLKRSLDIIIPVCNALNEAHLSGIIHRDIKPDNIFLHQAKEGEIVKVVDFGIAKLLGDALENNNLLTGTGNLIGTPLYMSPERIEGKTYDGKADVYSIGVMLYEMLAGIPPFTSFSPSAIEIMLKHMNEQPKPLRELNSDIPEEIEAIIMRTLSKRPDLRPTAKELAEVLLNAASRLPVEILETELNTKAHARRTTQDITLNLYRSASQKELYPSGEKQDLGELIIEKDSRKPRYTPERWRQIEDLFDAVVELAPAQRTAFLEQACANDQSLLTEVESLLKGRDVAIQANFLESAIIKRSAYELSSASSDED